MRLTGREPLPWAVALVALATYLLHGFGGALTRDLALYAYGGQQVVEGVPPYLGVLNRAGPLAHLLPAAGVLGGRALGVDEVLAMRVLFMLFAAVAVVLAYLVARDAFASRAAGVVSAAALLSFHGLIRLATYGPREKVPMVLFLLVGLWALTRRRWFTAGLAVGLATLCLQIAFFPGIAAVLAAVLLAPRGTRATAVFRVAAGGLLPLGVTVLSFAYVGALRELLDAFVLLNAEYSVATPLLPRLPTAWRSLRVGHGVSLWVLAGGTLAALLLGAAALRRRSTRSSAEGTALVACAAGVVGWFVWTLRDFDHWPDTLPLLPYAAVGLGGGLWWLCRRFSRRVSTAIVAVATSSALVVAVLYASTVHDDRLQVQRDSVERVLAVLPDGATIVSVEAPQPLVLSGKRNPTRHQIVTAGLNTYIDDTWPGGMPGFVRSIRAQRPDLVAVGTTVSRRWVPRLRPDYEVVGRAPQWVWMARSTLGDARLEQLRRAADG
jgi:hypothetical protein